MPPVDLLDHFQGGTEVPVALRVHDTFDAEPARPADPDDA